MYFGDKTLPMMLSRPQLLPGRLQSLKDLSVADNQLTSLPSSLSCLTALDQLSAYGNQLTALPVTSLVSCTSLSKIWLEGNPLGAATVKELLAAVQALPKCKALGLDVRQVSQVEGAEELKTIGSRLRVSKGCFFAGV
jgi:hypothetical protein